MVVTISESQLDDITRLFKECFKNNGYYEKIYGDKFEEFFEEEMKPVINYLFQNDGIYAYVDNDKVLGFLMHFEYRRLSQNTKMFNKIFEGYKQSGIPYKQQLHSKILMLHGKIEYVLCLGVEPSYRNKHIASQMLDYLINNHVGNNVAADVTNLKSIPMYEKRGFKKSLIDENYVYVYKEA